MTNNLTNALKAQKKSTEQVNQQISGMLGIPLDGDRRVEVPNRNAYVYVRLRNNQSEVIQAYNNQVSPSYNLPVLVERQGNRYVVVSIDTQRYENNWSSFASFLPRHGNTHSFNMESGGGADVVWVESKQMMPLLPFPSGSNGSMNVLVAPYTLKNDDGTWKHVGNTGTSSLAPYLPTGSLAVMGLVYVDSVSGNPYFTINSGTYFSNTITGSNQVYPYIPSVTNTNTQIPLAGIRLVTGTSEIGWDNIYDVRQWLHTQPTGSTGGGGISSVNIQDEGAPAGTATTFNFVGANVHASVSGSVVRVFVTGAAAGGSFTGDANSVVLTDGSGNLDTMPWLKWGTDAEEYIEFGADVAGKEVNAGKMGYNAFGGGYFDIVGAGTGSAERRVKLYDHLVVGESVEAQSYNLNNASNTYNITGSPHIHDNYREKLSGARTYYVRTDGSDSNSGLADAAAGAFLTIQKAVDVSSALDNGGFDITIQIRDGTYTGAVTLKSFVGSGSIIIRGNNGTPANVLISTTSSTCFSATSVVGVYQILDLKMQTTTSGSCIAASGSPTQIAYGNVVFGASAGFHVNSERGAWTRALSSYSISGGALRHLSAGSEAINEANVVTISLTGTPAFTTFAVSLTDSIVRIVSSTFSGTATGQRYLANAGTIDATSSETYIPGDALGATTNRGVYGSFAGNSRTSAQFDKTNTTLADITGLTSTLLAGRTYKFRAVLHTTSNVASGVKFAIAGTCTATAIIYEARVFNASALAAQTRAAALAGAVGGVTAVTVALCIIEGVITVANAGTLTVQFADNAGTNTSSVLIGSTFSVEDVT